MPPASSKGRRSQNPPGVVTSPCRAVALSAATRLARTASLGFVSAPKRGGFALAWLLVAALLLAQLLGLMHGVVHGPQAHLHVKAAVHLVQLHHDQHDHDHTSSAIAHDAHEGGWLASLFASHGDDSDCRLFDQASQGHAAPVLPMLSLPLVLCTVAFDISRGEALARWAALFDARGPPSVR